MQYFARLAHPALISLLLPVRLRLGWVRRRALFPQDVKAMEALAGGESIGHY